MSNRPEKSLARASKSRTARRATAFGTGIFLIGCVMLVVGLAWGFVRVFAPERSSAGVVSVARFDPTAMQAAVLPAAVAAEQAKILGLGSRYLGQPGMYAAEKYVRESFESFGLEVQEQSIRTLAPRTAYREVYRASERTAEMPYGERLSDIEVYPFMPNHLQPVVTPETGLEGELVLLDSKTLGTRSRFDDAIGVVDAGPGGTDTDFGYHWARYAQLGLKALIIAHREGLARVDWFNVARLKGGIVSSVPVNFVRLAATPAIFDHLGERIRLRVRVDFVEHTNRTLFGILKAAEKPAAEALVFHAPYDAASILPDLAPGGIPALNLAYLVELARGLSAVRATLKRDVVFVSSGASVMGEDGLNQLLRVLGFNTFAGSSNRLLDAFAPLENDSAGTKKEAGEGGVLETRLGPIRTRETQNQTQLRTVKALLAAFSDSGFLIDAASTRHKLEAFEPSVRDFFLEQFRYVLDTVVFERQEPALQAKLQYEREGRGRTDGKAFLDYLKARRRLDRANAAAGSSPAVLLSQNPKFAREIELRALVRKRFSELSDFHLQRQRELADDEALARLFSRYRDFVVMTPFFAPAPDAERRQETLTLHTQSARDTQSADLLLQAGARKLGLEGEAFHVEPMAASPTSLQIKIIENNCDPAPVWYYWMLQNVGYQSIGLANLGRQASYQQWASPVLMPFMSQLDSLSSSFRASGELALELSHGSGVLGSTQGYPWQRKSYGGQVLVSNVGQSVVPSYPLARAVIGARSVDREEGHSRPGYWNHPFYMADPYGRFDLPEQAADFAVWWHMYNDGFAFTPLAVGYGDDGLIAYMKDEGEEGQRLFKSVNVPLTNEHLVKNVSIVTFRAAPISILDLTNPQNFKDYSAVQMVNRDGLLPFSKSCQYLGLGFVTTYLAPDQHTDVILQSSRPDNEYVKETRAFLLNVTEKSRRSGREIAGDGYLVQDHPFLLRIPFEAGESVAYVNGQRLQLQNRYGMADARANRYHEKTLSLLQDAASPGMPLRDSALRARDAVSYAGLNHPVLRRSVFEAVIGILWYLGLLVPFVFFAEKLVFCFADVRKQIAAQVAIFLAVFGLLRLLHPAFVMVRSSLMILLGFLIILISCGIALVFASKAKENLAELRKRQGKVASAEVNKLGVLAASFLVGLNNMHRRKVRTGLTSATLVLLTFVMICFTSTQNDLVDETVTLGRAEYQGVLAKHADFLPMTESELFALKSKFGDRYSVAERRFYTGERDWNDRKLINPNLNLGFSGADGQRKLPLGSILRLTPQEPLRDKIVMLTQKGWLRPEHLNDDGSLCPVLIPDRLAERLGITKEAVDSGEVQVTINQRPFLVWGIFSAASLDALRDLDGNDLLPFDMERVSNVVQTDVGYTAPLDSPRIPAERVLIAPVRELKLGSVATSRDVIASAAVDMGKSSLRKARDEIEAHLEKTALPAFYGLDAVAYRGLRTRALTLAGLLDLLVPLLLAGLTVLNTMRGSVYERRSEIYVYNAVGIAPRYILVMFLAEAFVYVVVGSVLGYLLSQGVGRILTELGWTFGLNMTFASLSTIYASLAIAAAVFISTWFPARSAMQIAAPAEESGWKLPEPEGDVLAFDLPFNFRSRGRLAVLSFFERWLKEHGEGSAGAFFASVPELRVADAADLVSGGPVPEMRLTVWLKPFDLGVSQELSITTPFDAETGLFKGRLLLQRNSGTREAWLRLNRNFVTELRRHFLHWRAVPSAERDEMFAEAKQSLIAKYPERMASGPEPEANVSTA